jgi:DNA-binding transcriptional LysR family regulator
VRDDITWGYPLELRHLAHLITAIEKGTIGKAADALGISQPALTKSIRNLEAVLQVKLLERRSRGVVPTVYGDVVLSRGRAVQVELRDLINEIQALRAGRGGSLRIGVTQGVGSRLVPAATIRLVEQEPNTKLSVWTATTGELVGMLVNGDIEFAVASLDRRGSDFRIVEDVLFDDRPVIVVTPSHPLARTRWVQPKDLTKLRWALAGAATPLRRMLDQIFMSENVPPPVPTIECDAALYVKSVLIEGQLVGFLPRDQITVEEKAGLLKGIPFKTDVSARPIGIMRRRSEVLSATGMLLIKEIKKACLEFGYLSSPSADDVDERGTRRVTDSRGGTRSRS